MNLVTIIPSTGAVELFDAVRSARPDSDVLVVCDTPEFATRARRLVDGVPREGGDVRVVELPYRVGGAEWAGHRIYAASPHLVNHELVAFLDEDNWYAPEHLPALRALLADGAPAAWSLRRIHARDGAYVCDDTCESLGPYVVGVGGRRLVDTSCWAFRREWLVRAAHVWASAWGADAGFTDAVCGSGLTAPGTGLHSLCYRLGASDRSPKAEFFLEGNRRMNAHAATPQARSQPRT